MKSPIACVTEAQCNQQDESQSHMFMLGLSQGAEVNPSSFVDIFHGWSLSSGYSTEQLPFEVAGCCLHAFVYVVCAYECVCALCAGTECTINRT